MGMTRSDATSYLSGILAQLLTDAGLGTTDTAGALKEVIDDALLMTGVAYDDLATATVASADVLGFRLVLTYAALLRIDGARGDRASSFSEGGVSASWNRDSWNKRLEAAKAAALPYLSESGGWVMTAIGFDVFEPDSSCLVTS